MDLKDLEELALFPLPGVVLFPGAVMPLHIFEARYRAMTTDCLAGSKLLAVAKLRDDDSSVEPPPVHPTAGLGMIEASRKLSDGRFYLLLRGISRIRIESEHRAEKPYRLVHASILADATTTPPAVLAASEAQLISFCEQYAAKAPSAQELTELIREADGPGSSADLVAAALCRSPDARQAMLEISDPGARVDRAMEIVVGAMAELGLERHLN